MQVNPNSSHPTEPFLWGVATSGYQSEGGYNEPGQPQNNWSQCEGKGRVMRTGRASDFWTRYAEDFETCGQMGLNAFRIGLEWARIQPTVHPHPSAPPPFDMAALDAYALRLATCLQAGLEPIVTLHHFTHPAWLGVNAWLSEETVELFAQYVRTTIDRINSQLIEVYQLPPIRWWITINEPNMLVSSSYLSGQFPGGGVRGSQAMLKAYDLLLAAHVRAYNDIHDLYLDRGWETPYVSLNTYCNDLYWSEKVIWDLLSLAERGIKPNGVRDCVRSQAQQFEADLRRANLPFRRDLPYQAGRLAHFVSNFLGYRLFDLDYLQTYLETLNKSPRTSVFDYVAIDYYDPFIAHVFRLPHFSDFEFQSETWRAWLMDGITSKWWDWRTLPEGLHFFCQYYSRDFGNRPILIAENGMALRRKPDNSVASHRRDRLSRSAFIEMHVEQIRRLKSEGVPVVGYLHWSLTDNYEWGSYTPRFGLFGIDYTVGTERLVDNGFGDRPSETYARAIREAGF